MRWNEDARTKASAHPPYGQRPSSSSASRILGLRPTESTADTVSEPAAAKVQAPVAAQVAVATAAAPSESIALSATADAPALEAAPTELAAIEAPMAVVPDVERLSVWEARKQLKKQGFRFAFKRGERRVHHEDYDYYRVRKQSLPSGEKVAAGTKVIMQVKEIKYASGY